ncbi:hypothetical protein ACFWA5_06765 [Streptomyces mirabilis]|uniref:hypothetical protein n=1 Tax=Streptomyces mirabilis TaxID=68239 RepID=UPI00364D4C32
MFHEGVVGVRAGGDQLGDDPPGLVHAVVELQLCVDPLLQDPLGGAEVVQRPGEVVELLRHGLRHPRQTFSGDRDEGLAEELGRLLGALLVAQRDVEQCLVEVGAARARFGERVHRPLHQVALAGATAHPYEHGDVRDRPLARDVVDDTVGQPRTVVVPALPLGVPLPDREVRRLPDVPAQCRRGQDVDGVPVVEAPRGLDELVDGALEGESVQGADRGGRARLLTALGAPLPLPQGLHALHERLDGAGGHPFIAEAPCLAVLALESAGRFGARSRPAVSHTRSAFSTWFQ